MRKYFIAASFVTVVLGAGLLVGVKSPSMANFEKLPAIHNLQKNASLISSPSSNVLTADVSHAEKIDPILDHETLKILTGLQSAREGRLHHSHLDEHFSDDESIVIPQIERFLEVVSNHENFDGEEETNRLSALDYLGEKLIGRVATHEHARVLDILVKHLERNFLAGTAEHKQKQSLVGDQMDLIAYIARWDDDYAVSILRRHEGQPIHSFLKTGIENGLWLKGVKTEEIVQKLKS